MSRVASTPVAAPGRYPTAGVAVGMTAADTSNKNSAVMVGGEMLLVHNTDSASHTYTINSTPDDKARTGDITTQTIAAGAIHVVGPFARLGWQQTDGTLHFEANDTTVKFGVVRVNGA